MRKTLLRESLRLIPVTHPQTKIQRKIPAGWGLSLGGTDMSEVIVITSGKGGVGKTTTVANIGMGLAMLDKKVVVVDTDIGLRNLDVVMGLENRIVYNLVDVVNGSCRLKQALIKDKRTPNLYLLPSAQTKDKSAVSPDWKNVSKTDSIFV